MARAAQARPLTLPDETDRLQRILTALNRGQRLPRHQCLLWDPIERWPARWRQVLARLSLGPVPAQAPRAAGKTQLAIAQRLVVDGAQKSITTDRSLRWLRARSILCRPARCLSRGPDGPGSPGRRHLGLLPAWKGDVRNAFE
jgi:hypothetical protein